jgi:hypothetical protein
MEEISEWFQNSKKEGTDLILNEFIKTGNSTLILTLVKLFNKILKSGKFPKLWNHSLISSIYKSGDPNDYNNYRGISVASCLGKLFTKFTWIYCIRIHIFDKFEKVTPNALILYFLEKSISVYAVESLFTSLLQKRLTDYLEINKLISFNQGGFRSGYRTTDHIFILKTLINKYLHKLKSKLYVCFVDFKKAFDSIDRNAFSLCVVNKTWLNVVHKYVEQCGL